MIRIGPHLQIFVYQGSAVCPQIPKILHKRRGPRSAHTSLTLTHSPPHCPPHWPRCHGWTGAHVRVASLPDGNFRPHVTRRNAMRGALCGNETAHIVSSHVTKKNRKNQKCRFYLEKPTETELSFKQEQSHHFTHTLSTYESHRHIDTLIAVFCGLGIVICSLPGAICCFAVLG